MRYDWRHNSVICLHNLGTEPREVSISVRVPGEESRILVNLLSEYHSYPEKKVRHRILLEPYGYRWFRVGGPDYLLKRSVA
jgi:maltose alpha-D-glucosyltransferase / alpha-amylase